MKKFTLAFVIAALAAALSAQAPASQKDGGPGMPPQAGKAVETTISGVLVFVDDKPAIKTDAGTVFLAMPDFYKYAYTDGIKAGVTVKATGMLIAQPAGPAPDGAVAAPDAKGAKAASSDAKGAKAGESVIIAKEVSIGAKTYIIVGGQGPFGRQGDDRGPMAEPQGDQQAKGARQ
jgi:hypothetical protein